MDNQVNQAGPVNPADVTVAQNKNNNINEDKNNNRSRKSLVIIAVVLILAVGGLFEYNYYKNKVRNDAQQNQKMLDSNFPISREIIQQDFKNKDKKLKSGVVPPQNIKDRFGQAIETSRQAIRNNKPSRSEFKDLSEDYLNIASSYSILGEYAKAEEWYLKLLASWPKNYLANMNLGDLYIYMGLYQQAANKYLDTIELYPHDFRVPDKFADLYIKDSVSPDKLDKADKIYSYGIKNADNPKSLYRNYAIFLEDYLKDYKRALEMEREYQKITGSKEQQEIERLEKMIK